MQRYTHEILHRTGDLVDTLAPTKAKSGIPGHFWEQGTLPFRVGRRLLWSPSNTGPLVVPYQVVTLHDVVPFDVPGTLNRKFMLWYKFLQPKLLNRINGIITVSNFTRERLLLRIPRVEDKISVVHNGVDERFKPNSLDDINAAVTSLGLPSRSYVLSVGSLEPRKNVRRLLEAWELVVDRLPQEIWLILAGGRGVGRVFASVDTGRLPPRVHLTGHVPDELLPGLMSGAIAFVYPSYYEGFGLPPLEAMACGTATLTGDRACLPEIVGEGALKVDPFCVEAIADGVLRLVEDEDLRATLSKLGQRQAAMYSWAKAASETMLVLQKYL